MGYRVPAEATQGECWGPGEPQGARQPPSSPLGHGKAGELDGTALACQTANEMLALAAEGKISKPSHEKR